MLKIEKKDKGFLKFTGRLGAVQSEKAEEELSELNMDLTIDMSELEYISSMGLTVLVKTHKRLNAQGYRLRIINLNNHLKDIFKYTRLDEIFDIE